MEKYTIYCTPEQTKKAFKLGAPLFTVDCVLGCHHNEDRFVIRDEIPYVLVIPTAEQMIGWVEEQGIAIDITKASKKTIYYTLTRLTDIGSIYIKGRSENDYSSRKEATLAAIDAALDYLNSKK